MFKFLRDIKDLQETNKALLDAHKNNCDRVKTLEKEQRSMGGDIIAMSRFMNDLKVELDRLKESPQPCSGPVPLPPTN